MAAQSKRNNDEGEKKEPEFYNLISMAVLSPSDMLKMITILLYGVYAVNVADDRDMEKVNLFVACILSLGMLLMVSPQSDSHGPISFVTILSWL